MMRASVTKKDLILPKRDKESYKGQNGRLLVIGGSVMYAGAPLLCAQAALRSGCDYVTVVTVERVGWSINAQDPNIVVRMVKGNYITLFSYSKIRPAIDDHDVVLIGNGMTKRSLAVIQKIISYCVKEKKKVVIDADAIGCLSLNKLVGCLLTPHAGEFELISNEVCTGAMNSNVVIKKGPIDSIYHDKGIVHNTTGDAGMTVAGSGDALAGFCAGLMAQGLTLFDAAKTGCYLFGKAGERLYKERWYGYIATDLIDTIPVIIKEYANSKSGTNDYDNKHNNKTKRKAR